MGTVATTEQTNLLVSRAVQQDKSDACFQSAVSKAKRSLKSAPGGRRAWIFYQAVFGAYKPHRPICEMIDALIDAGAPEEDVEAIAFFFVSYMHARYASKEVKPLAVKETLTLSITADTDEVKAAAAAIAEPESEAALENVIAATVRDNQSNQNVLSVCRGKLSRLRMRLSK